MALPFDISGLAGSILVGAGLAILVVIGLALRSGKFSPSGTKYPLRVFIFEGRNNNLILDVDEYGRRTTNNEKGTIIELKNRKIKGANVNLPPIPLTYLHLTKSGTSYLSVYTPDNEKFYPIKFDPTEDGPTFLEEKAWDINDYHTGLQLRSLYPHQKGFWDKYGNVVMFVLMAFLFIMFAAVVFPKVQDIISLVKETVSMAKDMRGDTTQLSNAINNLAQALGGKGAAFLNATGPPPPY